MKISRVFAVSAITALTLFTSSSYAHMVTFAWKDTGAGSVVLGAEHWHGFQNYPCSEGISCSDNGGLTISGNGNNDPGSYGLNPFTIQWGSTLNNMDRDDMITNHLLTGYTSDGLDSGGGSYDNWLFTSPLVIGDGYWWFNTGTNCCIDTMASPVLVHLQGITSVDPGTGPGGPAGVPEPGIFSLLGFSLVGLGFARRRRMAS
jgi:PEP-CTERM motif-containing protein